MPERQLIASLDQAVEALYGLNVGVIGTGTGRHERPHKPCLLLAALDLIAMGKATPDRIAWDQALKDRFAVYFAVVRTPRDQCNPELPFRYLTKEGWWFPQQITTRGTQPMILVPTAAEAKNATIFATLTKGMDRYFLRSEDRLQLRQALVTRYFPHARPLLWPLFAEGTKYEEPDQSADTLREDEVPAVPGRNSAFRRKILEIYDCQCAACGLRIRLPQIDDLTFVDAAHLIPFSESRNDHPTNGLALCKNHHWAMDRFLIAPASDGTWKVSPILDERRSDGERSLISLQGKRVLLPSESAFAPSEAALRWRVERLMA